MRVLPAVEADKAQLRQTIIEFISRRDAPAQVLTTGLDGRPRIRLMGVWNDEFTLYIISRKPTHKQAELERDPRIQVIWYRYDVETEGIDQPLRQVIVSGTAELLTSAPALRAMPFYQDTILPQRKPSDPPNRIGIESSDEEIEKVRFGIVVRPTSIRAEGFVPGPRYPVYFNR